MANEMTDSERMTRQETKLETIEAVLMRLEAKVDAWQANFVSKELLEEKLKIRDDRIARMEQDKNSNKSILPLWVAVIVSIVVAIWSHWK